MGTIILCDTFEDAVVAYVVKEWNERELSEKLGRTVLQKLCYFIKAKGVPLDYHFDMYHYGPFSQELFFKMEDLQIDNIVLDQSKEASKSVYTPGSNADTIISSYSDQLNPYSSDISQIIDLFKQFPPTALELLATVHFFQTTSAKYYKRAPEKEAVIDRVVQVKKRKFKRELISTAYDALNQAGLFEWKSV